MKIKKFNNWFYRTFGFFSYWTFWETNNRSVKFFTVEYIVNYPQFIIIFMNFSLTIFFYDRRKSL